MSDEKYDLTQAGDVLYVAWVLNTTIEVLNELKEEYENEKLNAATIEEWREWYTNDLDDSQEENARRLLQNEGPGRPKSTRLLPLDAVYDEVQAICGKVPHSKLSYGDTGTTEPTGHVSHRQMLLCRFLDPDRRYSISNLQSLEEKRRKNPEPFGPKQPWLGAKMVIDEPEAN